MHALTAILLLLALVGVSAYGWTSLRRLVRGVTDPQTRRAVTLVIVAWVGLIVSQVPHIAPAFGLEHYVGGLIFFCELSMVADLVIVLFLVRAIRHGALNYLVEVLADVSRLRREASIDALTGLFNRTALARFRDSLNWPHWVSIMMDVDDFKAYNDRCGHQRGDAVLAQVGESIRKSIRTTDMAFRYGGEEFLVLCPLTALSEGVHVVERIRQNLRSLPEPMTVSAGIAVGEGRDLSRSIGEADEALYEAKRHGKDRLVLRHPPETPPV